MRRRPENARLNLIDLPRPQTESLYSQTRERLAGALGQMHFVDSVYEVGSARHPGISDLDLLVVVDDASRSRVDPLRRLSDDERYLFTHPCFVVPTSLAADLSKYVLLHGYRHLHGSAWSWTDHPTTEAALEIQTALEFLAKNVVDLYVQLTYGVIKVRVFLQHLKGVRLDLDIAGISGVPTTDALERGIALVDDWFVREDSEEQLARAAGELFPVMYDALAEATTKHTLSAPFVGTIPFARNIALDRGPQVELTHHGFSLPRVPWLDGRRQFNAQHRVNRFRVRLPMAQAAAGSYHATRFDFLRRAKSFATERFPAYSAPIPPLFYRAL